MPSKKNNRRAELTHQAFVPMVIMTLVLWVLYRSLFSFPVWFDETVGKAVFLGLPVWLYVSMTGFRPIIDSLRLSKFKPGLWRGLAVGGLYGFATVFIRLWQTGGGLQLVPVFLADRFWWEFLLALLTGFWESIFFFSFMISVIQDRFADWNLAKQLTLVMSIFLLFHIPNTFLRFDLVLVDPVLFLLTLFALGQSLLFNAKHNAYTLILSHALWGMVLLVYFS